MAKASKPASPDSKEFDLAKVLDPTQMSESELRAYVSKLELALGAAAAQNTKVTEKPWRGSEKRWVVVPPVNGQTLTINGKAYIGRMFLDRVTFDSVKESHQRAIKSELARMQTRGNLVPPHLLPADDLSSRSQALTIADL